MILAWPCCARMHTCGNSTHCCCCACRPAGCCWPSSSPPHHQNQAACHAQRSCLPGPCTFGLSQNEMVIKFCRCCCSSEAAAAAPERSTTAVGSVECLVSWAGDDGRVFGVQLPCPSNAAVVAGGLSGLYSITDPVTDHPQNLHRSDHLSSLPSPAPRPSGLQQHIPARPGEAGTLRRHR